jgi:hypothetical protein
MPEYDPPPAAWSNEVLSEIGTKIVQLLDAQKDLFSPALTNPEGLSRTAPI